MPAKRPASCLVVDKVVEPLLVEGHSVVVEQRQVHGQVAVGRPAVLLALGAVRGNRREVVEIGPARHLPNAVEQSVRAGEFPDRRSTSVCMARAVRLVLIEFHRGARLQFHILESVVGEIGRPRLRGLRLSKYRCRSGNRSPGGL